MGGSSALLLGSSIRFDPRLQLLPRTERDHAPCTDGDLLAGLRVAARALILIAQIEITETGELHLLAGRKSGPNLFEEHVDQLARFALVQSQLVEQGFRHLCFSECHALLISY